MRYLLLLVPLSIAAAPLPSAIPAQPIESPTETLPADDLLLSRDDDGRMTVGVTVGGAGPYPFLVDTGAERTVISRQLAQRLGLAAGAPTGLQSVFGRTEVATVNIPELQVSTRQVAVRDAPALEYRHMGAHGMLGVDSLARQTVRFDFKRGLMSVSPSRPEREFHDGTTIVVTARRRHGRLLFGDAQVNGHSVVIVVDTGSEISIGNEALRRKLSRRRGEPKTVEVETVTGQKVHAEIVQTRTLEVGGMTIQGMTLAFAEASVFHQLGLDRRPALLLGMDAMRSFDSVSIDFATRKVRFVLPKATAVWPTRLAAL